MSDVTLADVPGHVGRRPRSNDTELQSELVHGINLCRRLQPPTHPSAAGLVVPGLTRHWTTASSLPILAEKDFRGAGNDGAESGRIAEVPMLPPTKLFEPCET